MATPLTVPSKVGHQTFLWSEPVSDLDNLKADIAYLGIPYGQAYIVADMSNDQSKMPWAMRQATDRILRQINHYDFDLGGPLYDGKPIRAVDCGDVYADVLDYNAHPGRAEQAVRNILKAGAMPIILGGDHAIPIPVLRAMDDQGPITLVQVDQHLDWREEINGVRDGLSNVIRRASEMKHVNEIFQIGLHASGSARQEEYDAAHAYGAHLISSYEVHDNGMDSVLKKIPDGGRYYLTIDLDGIDPAIAPAVGSLCPGGLNFMQVRKLIHGLVKKGRVVGMDIVEIMPSMDLNKITCITAGRFVVNMVGAAVRAGYFDKRAK